MFLDVNLQPNLREQYQRTIATNPRGFGSEMTNRLTDMNVGLVKEASPNPRPGIYGVDVVHDPKTPQDGQNIVHGRGWSP